MTETNSLIQIKGMRDGLLVSLDDAPWQQQREALIAQVDEQPSFFQGARLALDVSSQVLRVNDLVELRDQLSERGITLWAVISESSTTENTAQLLGLATRISKPRPEEARQFSVSDLGEETALFLSRTLRSGTRIEFAGHAGAKGNRAAVICALDLSPMQLRIADQVSGGLKPRESPKPERARINENGKLQTEFWSGG
jgi:septum site-determining protein MinC